MLPYQVGAARLAVARVFARLAFGLIGVLVAVLAAGWIMPASVQAGTIIIVDGPDTPPVNGVVTDGYIQNYLTITGSLTVSTTDVITGLDEIRVQQNAVITWTTGRTLTLDADASIVISGTIQHDGPVNGAGGLTLRAPNGTVYVGPGTQRTGVAVGSRFGLTRVQAANLVLKGGSKDGAYAQLGYYNIRKGAGIVPITSLTATGAISVTVSQAVSATASVNFSYVQIGNGGADFRIVDVPPNDLGGDITVEAGGDVFFQGGNDNVRGHAYAQLGNGGWDSFGNHSGSHIVQAGGEISFLGGNGDGYRHPQLGNYAQLGNGGLGADGVHNGDHRVVAGAGVTFQAGRFNGSYTQLGNGGHSAFGDMSGDHSLVAGGNVSFTGGWNESYAQFGNGGMWATGNHSGDHSLSAIGNVRFQGGSTSISFAQYGNGGWGAIGNHSGNHILEADGDVSFMGGRGSGFGNAFVYAHYGNGGADGNHSGNHKLVAGGDVSFVGGNIEFAFAQYGNGVRQVDGSLSGSLALTSTGSLTVSAGGGEYAIYAIDAYAMIGHGSDVRRRPDDQSTGSRAGDITVSVGETAVFSGSQVGHLTADGVLSVTQGNTLIGVSQNHPFDNGTGQLLVNQATRSSFSSASAASGGELRFYLPRADSQQIPTSATFNGESFTTASAIPLAQLAGVAAFGAGPYLPNYSFYLAPRFALVPTDILYLPALQR